MPNDEIEKTEEIPFKSRWPLWIKSVSILVIASFFYSDVVRAADPTSFQLQIERQKESKFLPRSLLEQQKKHEDFIQRKEDQSNLSKSLEDEFTQRMRKKKPFLEDDRRRGGSGDGGRLEYTLDDYNEEGEPMTLNDYVYDENGNLEKIVQYDVSGVNVSQYVGAAQEIEGKDGQKFKGGFQDFNKASLTDDMIVSESYFEGEGDNRKVAYVLSGFEDGTNKPTLISIYARDGSGTLKAVKTFNIEGLLDSNFGDASIRNSLSEDRLESLS